MRVLLLALAVFAGAGAAAQPAGRWHVGVAGSGVWPTQGTAERYGALVTGHVAVGRSWPARGTSMEARAERLAFSQGEPVLRLAPEAPPVDASQLDLALTLTGGSLHVRRALLRGRVRPTVGAGVGLYHWRERRAAYQDTVRTTPVPALDRPSQWSAGFEAGPGVEVALAAGAAVTVGAAYHVVMGELWPALDLGLESVSTFQYATLSAGVRYTF